MDHGCPDFLSPVRGPDFSDQIFSVQSVVLDVLGVQIHTKSLKILQSFIEIFFIRNENWENKYKNQLI